MRSAGTPRVCEYPDTTKPGRIHGEPLKGPGRWKYCATHSKIVQQQKQRLGSPRWQREWRARNLTRYKNRRWIYYHARRLNRWLMGIFPEANSRLLYWAILQSFRLAFDRATPQTTFRRFRHPLICYGWSVFSDKPVVPSISLGFKPPLRSRDLPWVVEMVIQGKGSASFRIISSENLQGHIVNGQTKWHKARIRQIFRLAATLGWRGRGAAIAIGMPTIARVLGLGDFYYFQCPGKVPWQWVLAFKREHKLILPFEWTPAIREAQKLRASCLRRKRRCFIRLDDYKLPLDFPVQKVNRRANSQAGDL